MLTDEQRHIWNEQMALFAYDVQVMQGTVEGPRQSDRLFLAVAAHLAEVEADLATCRATIEQRDLLLAAAISTRDEARAENERLRRAVVAATACTGWCEVKTERFDKAGHTVGGHCQCGGVRRRMDVTIALAAGKEEAPQ